MYRRSCCSNPPRGLTLPELLMTLAVAAALLGLGVPSFISLLNESRLTAFSNDLHGVITLARSEAIRRGRRVTLCTSSDGDWCNANAHWHAGWVLFVDANGNGRRDAGEQLIRTGSGATHQVQASGNGTMARYLSYVPSGRTQAASGAMQMGTIKICNRTARRSLIISASGRVRVERASDCE